MTNFRGLNLETLHSNIVDHMEEAILLVNSHNGAIIYTNPAANQMFGYGSYELVGRNISFLAKSIENFARSKTSSAILRHSSLSLGVRTLLNPPGTAATGWIDFPEII